MFEDRKRTKQENNIVHTGYSVRRTEKGRKAAFEDVRVNKKASYGGASAVQMCPEEHIRTIEILCNEKHGYNITRNDAISYYKLMQKGVYPQIQNHNAIIRPWGNSYHVIRTYFSGNGMMGRIAKEGGEQASFSMNSGSDLDSNLPGVYVYSASMTVNSRSLASVSPRENLNSVMGGSAFDQTGIQNSEFLHMIGHQLGGEDKKENLLPGYHALNTAMIPIENLVHDLAQIGVNVDYNVLFYPRVGNCIWVDRARLTVKFEYNSQSVEYSCEIQIPGPDRLSQESYNGIYAQINEIRNQVKKLLR